MSDADFWHDLPLFAPDGAEIPKLGESAEDVPSALGVLSHIMHDEETPEELAEDLRGEGNTFYKQGSKYGYRRAVEKYTAAINVPCATAQVTSAAYANRSAAELKLLNFGRALSDAEASLALDGRNAKCRFRAAQAARRLRRPDAALAHCDAALRALEEQGLGKSGDARLFRRERAGVLEEKRKADRVEAERAKKEARAKAQDSALGRLLKARGVTMGLPLFSQQRKYPRCEPVVENGGAELLWPVLVVYPEVGESSSVEQSDYLEGVSENASVGDILATLFPPGAPPAPWDVTGLYAMKGDKLVVKYRKDWTKLAANADSEDEDDFVGSTLGPDDVGPLRTVRSDAILGEVIAKADYIVPKFPVLYVFPQ